MCEKFFPSECRDRSSLRCDPKYERNTAGSHGELACSCSLARSSAYASGSPSYGKPLSVPQGIKALETELLSQNAKFKDCECTEDLMSKTAGGKALYMHCLPAGVKRI